MQGLSEQTETVVKVCLQPEAGVCLEGLSALSAASPVTENWGSGFTRRSRSGTEAPERGPNGLD